MKVLFILVWILCSLALWYIYHKLFVVYYTDVAMGCGKEFVVSGFFGVILAAIIFAYWYISIPVAILFVVAICKKRG